MLQAQTQTRNTIRLRLPALHSRQREIERGWRRFNVVVCGRRFGKDVFDRHVAIKAILAGAPVGWWEPTYRSLLDNWKIIRNYLAPITSQISQQEHIIDLVTGGRLEMWSADNPDAGRGRKYKRAIINEAATVKDLEYTWNAVIRPTLMDLSGDAILSGTPKGLNYFYTLYNRDEPDWSQWHYPTWDNPFIPNTEIEAARRDLPERVFKQEIEAVFLSDGAYFQGVDQAATILEPEQPEAHKDHYIVMGVDWALSNDYTVLTVACRDCHRVVDWDRFNQLDFTYQREKLVSMAQRWGAYVLPERNSIGEPNIEMLQGRVNMLYGPDGKPGFTITATSKTGLIQSLAMAIERNEFQLPLDYADELRVYQVETLTGGYPKFGAPPGQHDDRVISLALAWYGVRIPSPLGLVDFA